MFKLALTLLLEHKYWHYHSDSGLSCGRVVWSIITSD